MTERVVVASGLYRLFEIGDVVVEPLKNADLTGEKGEFISLNGQSGVGKTALLSEKA